MPTHAPAQDTRPDATLLKREAVGKAAHAAGLLDGQTSRIQGRITDSLLAAAKTRSGITSDTELLEYALARVAIEDDFGLKLLTRKGRVPADVDLEFSPRPIATAPQTSADQDRTSKALRCRPTVRR